MVSNDRLITTKKPSYRISPFLADYLTHYNRTATFPIFYQDLMRFSGSVAVMDKNDNDSLWVRVFYNDSERDEIEDNLIGLNSSALSLGKKSIKTVSYCYVLTCFFLALAALNANLGLIYWPFWLITTLGMQREVFLLSSSSKGIKTSGLHFTNQVRLGSLLLLGMICSKII